MAEAALGRQRLLAGLVLATAVALFAAMPAWRGYPPPPVTSYAASPEAFSAKVEAMTAAHATGEVTRDAKDAMADGIPVVRPPAGDVYLLARRWQFWPIVELEAGRTYRLHVSSADILHGFHLNRDIDLLLTPGIAHTFTVTPRPGERLVMQCSEYCGLLHNRMKATLRVVAPR